MKYLNICLISLMVLLLVAVSMTTRYYGHVDVGDYSDIAKFFAGKYPSKIRGSHSYLFGFVHFPFLTILDNYAVFKITGLISLFLIIYSVYVITNKNKRAFLLMLFSPIVWYMAPWISPIELSSLFFLWSWYFMVRYNNSSKLPFLFYSGILLGLSWAFWDTMLFIGIIFALCFLYDKKSYHSVYFIVFVLLGLAPRLLLDYYLFNFPFYTILKNLFSNLTNLSGGIYNRKSGLSPKNFTSIISILLALPFYYWILYKKDSFIKYKRTIIFLSLTLLLILLTPQPRYLLSIVPMIIILLGKELSIKHFKFQLILLFLITIFFISPYVMQINYSIDNQTEGIDFSYLIDKGFVFNLSSTIPRKVILSEFEDIINDYPHQAFIIGNLPDDYQSLSHLYWGNNVNELVSIQDYELYLKNQSILYKKEFKPKIIIQDRRQIWIKGGLMKNENDKTNYNSLSLGIGIREPLDIEDFNLVRKYGDLYLSEKYD